MTEKELNDAFVIIGEEFLNLYSFFCKIYPQEVVITAMTRSLGACATEAGFDRDKTISDLNAVFDDTEARETQ